VRIEMRPGPGIDGTTATHLVAQFTSLIAPPISERTLHGMEVRARFPSHLLPRPSCR
jgi:hypothetical protein